MSDCYMCPIDKVNLKLKENRTKLVAENLHLEKELQAREEEIASLKRDVEIHKDAIAAVRRENKWLWDVDKINLELKQSRAELVAENLQKVRELTAKEEEIASLKEDIEWVRNRLVETITGLDSAATE